MERAVSSAGIGRTDTDEDAKPTARSLLKIYRFELRGFDPMAISMQEQMAGYHALGVLEQPIG
jgi:hypothetical protein